MTEQLVLLMLFGVVSGLSYLIGNLRGYLEGSMKTKALYEKYFSNTRA